MQIAKKVETISARTRSSEMRFGWHLLQKAEKNGIATVADGRQVTEPKS